MQLQGQNAIELGPGRWAITAVGWHNVESPGVLVEIDKRSLLHPFTSITTHLEQGPRIMVEGRGIRVRDAEGREYLDAMAGLWCVNVGYGRPEIADAMAEQARRLPYYHAFLGNSNEPASWSVWRQSTKLCSKMPGPFAIPGVLKTPGI